MKHTYLDFIKQSYRFPQNGFDLVENNLTFYGVSLKDLIDKYGTPFRLMYLPRISDQIRRASQHFTEAITKHSYKGKYYYCYCTKSNHFAPVIEKALLEGVHLETSSAYDIDLILQLYDRGLLTKKTWLIHNGYKTENYIHKVLGLQQMGFTNSIMILDSKTELKRIGLLANNSERPIQIGIRMAIKEEAEADYHTSRLGIRPDSIIDFYRSEIVDNAQVEFKMLHFFVDSGIKDSLYYWREFDKALHLYAQLRKESQSIQAFNLGGGFPIKDSLGFEYDYKCIVDQIIDRISHVCDREAIEHPDIFTEFGKYTVGESGASIFSVLETKQQSDSEMWYIVDNSLMNTIPDIWPALQQFVLLPINKWEYQCAEVNIGGISCDHSDYYNKEHLGKPLVLPIIDQNNKEPLYIGVFHTGAYQDAISGYGGIRHCLIPSPKYILIDRVADGSHTDRLFQPEQTADKMSGILGY